MSSTKPYCIAKHAVWKAYQLVKSNGGAAGVDDETISMFEQNLGGNLYKLWNRMSSGSYFPPPVKQVEIPKAKGGTRKLGIPMCLGELGYGDVGLAGSACHLAFKGDRIVWPPFAATPAGAHASAVIYSLIETAKANGLEPYTWLRRVLRHLPEAKTVEQYEALLPWNLHAYDLAADPLG
jgi:hypothetical protein